MAMSAYPLCFVMLRLGLKLSASILIKLKLINLMMAEVLSSILQMKRSKMLLIVECLKPQLILVRQKMLTLF